MRKIIFGNAKKLFLIYITIYMAFVVGISGYLCSVYSNNLSKQTQQIAVYKVQRMEVATSKMVSNVEYAAQKLRTSQEFCELICGEEVTTDNAVAITKYLDEAVLGVNEISGYFAFSPSYNEWAHNIPNWDETAGVRLQIAFNINSVADNKMVWYSGDMQGIENAWNNYIICATNISSRLNPSHRAKIYFFLDKASFNSIIENADDNALVGMMNDNGQILCVNNADEFRATMKKSNNLLYNIYIQGRDNIADIAGEFDNYIVAYNDSVGTGLKFWCLYEKSDFYRDVYIFGAVIATVVACVLLLLVVLMFILFRGYLTPLNVLAKKMSNFEINDKKQKINLFGSKEIDLIVDGYNQMVDNVYAGVEEIKRKENEKREAEFKAMRYQINPHFVYNTISSLKVIAISHGEKQISDSLTMFSRVLKYALFCNEKFTEFSNEIDFIHNYIGLVNVRYYDKLIVDFMIDEDTAQCMVPTFLIQPIIENSIMHGLRKQLNSGEIGRIKISSYLKNGNVCISVEDNGVGMDEEKLSTLLDGEDKALNSKNSIGLKNINERIKLAYGNEYGLSAESEPGKYTRITAMLPFSN